MQGDLVMLKDEKSGEVVDPVAKYRALGAKTLGKKTVVWIGPATFTPRDIEEFLKEFEGGLPRNPKYRDCKPVDIGLIEKVLDS